MFHKQQRFDNFSNYFFVSRTVLMQLKLAMQHKVASAKIAKRKNVDADVVLNRTLRVSTERILKATSGDP